MGKLWIDKRMYGWMKRWMDGRLDLNQIFTGEYTPTVSDITS